MNQTRHLHGKCIPIVLGTLLCSAGFLLSTIPCRAQQTLQILHDHVPAAVTEEKASRIGPLSADKHLHLAIQLPLRNQADLESLLERLYDPNSPDFRKYLSVEEFTERYGPTLEDYQAVVDFVRANGMTVLDTPKNRMLVEVDGAVPQVEKAFHVSMTEYQHPTEERTFFAADREPAVNLSVPLRHISGLNNFHMPQSHLAKSMVAAATGGGSGPNSLYLPNDVRAAYYGNGPLNGANQSVGLVTFWGFNVSDVNLTYTSVGLPVPNVPINTVLLGGLTAPMTSTDDAEPITDIVAAMSIAPNLKQVREYQCCGDSFSGSGAEAGQDVIYNKMATENICKQISQSAGVIAQPEIDDPYFQEMAAQGQSFFAASGDGGSAPAGVTYDYYYPGDNAWLTSVGATHFVTTGPGGAWVSETADNWSGGGFSDGPDPSLIPSYQVPVINSSNGGSTVYRNLPDVAALGDSAYLCINGVCNQTGGTSYSSPLWASFMALVNQQAVEEGKPTVGFINPIIYGIGQSSHYASDFHDMIGGNDDCCGQTIFYNVVAGYDLVSGWGTPTGQNLINDLITPPGSGGTPSFTLAPSSSSLSVTQGASGSDIIQVTDVNGFTGNVTLSASGLPSGVTVAFATNPTNSTSVLTLTVSGTATVGTATITITGTSGSTTATTTIALAVTARATPGFTLSPTTSSLSVAQGASGTDTIKVTDFNGFTGSVAFTASGLPSGVTAVFNPASSTNSSVVTLTANSTAAAGAYTVTITGTSGSTTATTTIALSINSSGGGSAACTVDYTISSQNSSQFGASITIKNGGTTALSGWVLTWSFANGQTINSSWNGTVSQSGTNVTVSEQAGQTWENIPANGSYTGFGFNGTWNGTTNSIPTSFKLNGTTCTVN